MFECPHTFGHLCTNCHTEHSTVGTSQREEKQSMFSLCYCTVWDTGWWTGEFYTFLTLWIIWPLQFLFSTSFGCFKRIYIILPQFKAPLILWQSDCGYNISRSTSHLTLTQSVSQTYPASAPNNQPPSGHRISFVHTHHTDNKYTRSCSTLEVFCTLCSCSQSNV